MKVFCLVLFLLSLFNMNVNAMDLSAESAILYEPETESVLYQDDIYDRREIASTTKIMTAVVVLENANLDEIVKIPKECTGIEGSSIYLRAGECVSVSDLLYGMLLNSGNDAANALAEYVSSKRKVDFIDLMNDKAKQLGMSQSSFKNPSGLPDRDHFSTAYDMALLASYAMKNPKFAEIVGTKTYSAKDRQFSNHNKMLRIYEGTTGIKTGYTKTAGRCLVSSAERNGMSLIAVTLSAPNDWDDHKKLFDFGFLNYSVLKYENESLCVPVVGGECDFVNVTHSEKSSVLVARDRRAETEIILPPFVYAPIEKGDVVGEVRFIIDGEISKITSIICMEEIKYKKKRICLKDCFCFRSVGYDWR